MNEQCSCGSRLRQKCAKECDSGCGKMCFKEDLKAWSKEFSKRQEDLPIELQQLLADNIWELYED